MFQNVVLGSCSGACGTSSDCPHEVTSIKVEQDTDMDIKVEEIPEPISFPPLKSEQDEVSYVSVCHKYTESLVCFFVLRVFLYLNISRVVYGCYFFFSGYVSPYEGYLYADQHRGMSMGLYLTTRI
jgi:hypothetical protein